MRGGTDLTDMLEEADELVTRYAPRGMAETWARNLEVVATLATVHQLWQGPDVKVGGLIAEMTPFLRVAFEMGRAAAEGDTQNGTGIQND